MSGTPQSKTPPSGAVAPTDTITLKNLKNCLDAIEKLKAIRRELKGKLQKEGLRDEEDVDLAEQLVQISRTIQTLEKKKLLPLNDAE